MNTVTALLLALVGAGLLVVWAALRAGARADAWAEEAEAAAEREGMTTVEHVTVDLADLRKAADESDDVVVVPAWLILELLDERQRLREGLEVIVRGMEHAPGTWDNTTRLVDGFYRGVAASALTVPE